MSTQILTKEAEALKKAVSGLRREIAASGRSSDLLAEAFDLLQKGEFREGLDKLKESTDGIEGGSKDLPKKLRGCLESVTDHWANGAAVYALFEGIIPIHLEQARFGVKHVIGAHKFAKRMGLKQPEVSLKQIDFPKENATRMEEAIGEFKAMVRYLSIENPFDRWKVIAEDVSKEWPNGWSAVDEIRDQRGRLG